MNNRERDERILALEESVEKHFKALEKVFPGFISEEAKVDALDSTKAHIDGLPEFVSKYVWGKIRITLGSVYQKGYSDGITRMSKREKGDWDETKDIDYDATMMRIFEVEK